MPGLAVKSNPELSSPAIRPAACVKQAHRSGAGASRSFESHRRRPVAKPRSFGAPARSLCRMQKGPRRARGKRDMVGVRELRDEVKKVDAGARDFAHESGDSVSGRAGKQKRVVAPTRSIPG